MKLGACHVETPFIELGQLSTALYFGYFVLIVPVVSLIENTLMDLSLVDFNKNAKFNPARKI
jgi:ubiquinol-cytochrome c reductase cytochrome b subunit